MSKINGKLELLSPSARIFDNDQKNALKDKHIKAVNSLFLQKREILEADDFNGSYHGSNLVIC